MITIIIMIIIITIIIIIIIIIIIRIPGRVVPFLAALVTSQTGLPIYPASSEANLNALGPVNDPGQLWSSPSDHQTILGEDRPCVAQSHIVVEVPLLTSQNMADLGKIPPPKKKQQQKTSTWLENSHCDDDTQRGNLR